MNILSVLVGAMLLGSVVGAATAVIAAAILSGLVRPIDSRDDDNE